MRYYSLIAALIGISSCSSSIDQSQVYFDKSQGILDRRDSVFKLIVITPSKINISSDFKRENAFSRADWFVNYTGNPFRSKPKIGFSISDLKFPVVCKANISAKVERMKEFSFDRGGKYLSLENNKSLNRQGESFLDFGAIDLAKIICLLPVIIRDTRYYELLTLSEKEDVILIWGDDAIIYESDCYCFTIAGPFDQFYHLIGSRENLHRFMSIFKGETKQSDL